MMDNLFEAMLYRLASDPKIAKSVAGNPKDELWYERQQVKKWYEERTDGLPGDEYIYRCICMLDWWLKESNSSQPVVRMFHDYISRNPEDAIGARSDVDTDADIEDLTTLLSQQFQATRGSECWLILAEAVAECAVGCLIEINEDIAENVEEDHLRMYFEDVQNFWESFYDVAFQGKEPQIPDNESGGQRTSPQALGKAKASNESTATESDTSCDSQVVDACAREALGMIKDGLDNRSHQLNQIGGFSKIPDDFKFLGVLKLGLEFGHLKREGILLYACLSSYCVTLLRKFFILQRNQNLEARDVQPSDRVQDLIDEASNDMVSALQNLVATRAQEQFQSLRNFRASSPTAARISFESQLPDALDMAMAALREAMEQAIALESSEGFEQSEALASVMVGYAPMGLDDFESHFRQSPWAFYDTSDLCVRALEGTVTNPKQFLERIFDQWQDFHKDDTRTSEINRQSNQAGDEGTPETSRSRSEISSSVTTPHGEYGLTSHNASLEKGISPVSQTPLVGTALIEKVKAIGDDTPGDQARACGYIMSGQPQRGDVETFYAALYEAYRAGRK